MIVLILICAALFIVAGLLILVRPEFVLHTLRKHQDKQATYVSAIAARVVIGLLLVSQADHAKFPFAIGVIGWLFLIAAAGLALAGPKGFKRLLSWVLEHLSSFARLGGVFAIALGAFIIYSFV